MAKKTNYDEIAGETRSFIAETARHKLLKLSEGVKDFKPGRIHLKIWNAVSKATRIPRSTLEGMISRQEGGLDNWIKLYAYLFEVDFQQLTRFFIETTEQLSQARRLSDGQNRWVRTGNQLNEDKRLFWADAIAVFEGVDPGYSVKSRKKKK